MAPATAQKTMVGDTRMNPDRRSAVLAGVLFIVGTVAGTASLGLFTDPILSSPDYLTGVSEGESKVLVGALLELVMGVSLAGMALAVYPVLKKFSARAAVGYFGARLVEAVMYVISVVGLLVLLTLSQEFVGAGAPDASWFQTSGELLLAVRDWSGHVVLDVAVFPLGAAIFYVVLYRSRLVPRWLSGWGLIGAALYWAAGLFVMFDLVTPLDTIHIALQAPLGVQEMVLAVWLIVKGFNPSVIAAASASSGAPQGRT